MNKRSLINVLLFDHTKGKYSTSQQIEDNYYKDN